jgi:hypothetical protein
MENVFLQFAAALASQEMQALGCSGTSQTHNTYLKVANEFTDDAQKTSSRDWGKVLNKKLRVYSLVMKTAAGRT